MSRKAYLAIIVSEILFIALVLGGFFWFRNQDFFYLARSPISHTPVRSVATSSPVAGVVPASSTVTSTEVVTATSSTSTIPQFVVISFDGSRDREFWEESRALARDMTAQGHPVHFSYFISGVYFLTPSNASLYQPPTDKAGTSKIGWGFSKQDIENRIDEINAAYSEGHDIGSHVNGHFDGSVWSYADWKKEFDQFGQFVFGVADNNAFTADERAKYPWAFDKSEMIGFRAPELGKSVGLWPALKNDGYQYDASRTGKPGTWPYRYDGLWEFPLIKIPFASSTTSSLLSMDYNFYVKQTKAQDIIKKDTPEWTRIYNEMSTSYDRYFEASYTGNHAPVIIGHHFEKWNGGAYWQALQDFVRRTCGLPNVQCVSFRELMHYMNNHPELAGPTVNDEVSSVREGGE